MLTGYRTIISASVALIGGLLGLQGIDVDEATLTDALISALDSILVVAGAIGAIVFRLRAKPKA